MDQSSTVKQQIMEYYNSVGWKNISGGVFHNASREDLRPVVQEYVHRCRMRVRRYLSDTGKYLLDAGSGPIQYPEYLDYSQGYQYRVCLDISRLALVEARERIGDHGLMVLGDITQLPFRRAAMDGVVSLHAVHHVPSEEQLHAFSELKRVLSPDGTAVIVHSWGNLAPVHRLTNRPAKWVLGFKSWLGDRIFRKGSEKKAEPAAPGETEITSPTFRNDYAWVRENLGGYPGFRLTIWRTIGTRFSQAFITRYFFGKAILKILYSLEEAAPVFFARFGQYPMIIYSGSEPTNDTENEG